MNSFVPALFATLVSFSSLADARPQFNFFGGGGRPQGGRTGGGFDINRPDHLVAGAGVGLASIFAVKNIAEGDDQISFSPTLGAGFNPDTGRIVPQFGVAAKVGSKDVAPTFNLGGQLDNGRINPTFGAGVQANNGNSPFGLGANTGVVLTENGPQSTFGANAAVGQFQAGSLLGGNGFGRRKRSVTYYAY